MEFPCSACNIKFTRKFNRDRHFVEKHSDSPINKCLLCGKEFLDFEDLQLHQEHQHTPGEGFELKESAMRRKVVTYRYLYNTSERDSKMVEVAGLHDKIYQTLMYEIGMKKSLKFALIFIARMVQIGNENDVVSSIQIPFRSCQHEASILTPSKLYSLIAECFLKINATLEDFTENGSGWVLANGIGVDIEIAQYPAIRVGGTSQHFSVKNLPGGKQLQNVASHKGFCLLYCIIYFLYASYIKDPEKGSEYSKFFFIFNDKEKDYRFPMHIHEVPKFLHKIKHLNIKINIFLYQEWQNTRFQIHPLERGLCNKESKKTLNLLLICFQNNYHFVIINNLNKFLRKTYHNKGYISGYSKPHFCENCLNHFSSETILTDHQKICLVNKPILEEVPDKFSDPIYFKNNKKTIFCPLIGFFDFECVMNDSKHLCEFCNSLRCKCNEKSYTKTEFVQKPFCYSFVLIDKNDKVIIEQTYYGNDAAENFLEFLFKLEKDYLEPLFEKIEEMRYDKKSVEKFESSTCCYICKKKFNSKIKSLIKVRDHCHYSGKFLGAACNSCNLKRRRERFISIFCHNASHYDLHFLVNAINKFSKKIDKITVLPYNSEHFRTIQINSFKFLDSLAFLQSSLNVLTTNLYKSNHDYIFLKQMKICKTNEIFDEFKMKQILKKGFFPYEFCKSISQMESISALPSKEHFYSSLTEEKISDEDYDHALNVWALFKVENLLEYALIYCQTDTMLLAEVFMKFRKEMMSFSGLDCAQYISLPGFSWYDLFDIINININMLMLFLFTGIPC